MSARLSISVLGPFHVTLNGEHVTNFRSDKMRALLVYLALHAGQPHRRDALASLLWPNSSDKAARNSLRQALFKLRRTIDDRDAASPSLLHTTKIIQFDKHSDYWLDVADFTTLLTACRTHAHAQLDACRPCRDRLARAVALYRGEFLAGFSISDSQPFDEWLLFQREMFHAQVLDALDHLTDYHERRGDYALARRYARRQIMLEPWREPAHRQLMRVLALSGRRNAALSQYEVCRQVLAAELGVEPAPETLELYELIQAGTLGGRPA